MDCGLEVKNRVQWIKEVLADSKADGIVYGNSGGKDCTLVAILCRKAAENVTGIMMPCESSVNYGLDKKHALAAAKQYDIRTEEIDLTAVKVAFREVLGDKIGDCAMAYANINPRLRMTALYAYAYSKNYLVAGTGNRSETTLGYFTKWGDGAYDFNPISDLTVSEVYELLEYLGAPREIIDKAPSAGLYEGQTDERELGFSYQAVDNFLLKGEGDAEIVEKIEKRIASTSHKRKPPLTYR